MNEELLQKVYDKTGLEQNGFSFNQFKQGLSNDEFVQSVFDKSGLSDNGFNINQFKSVINEDGNLPEASPTRTEEQNYLDGWLGNIEFIDDMARAWGQGKVDRQVVEKTGALLEGGGAEDIDNYLQAVQNQQNAPVSDEYRKFEKDLADNDKGLVGVMQTLGDIWNNKSATSEILVRSVSSMFNKDAAKLGAAGALAGTAIPIIGTGVGAMWGVSTATESMMSLSNLIQEELGGNLTEENVKGLLEDKEKFNDLKNKALLRGFTIGTFDAVAGGIGSALGAKMASKVGKAFTTTGTELVGAFTGELAGQKAEGKEFDLTEATLEAFADPTAPFVIGKTTFFDPVAKRIRNKKESTYTINNGKADRKTVSDLIKAAQSKEDLEGITVANDSELEAELSERFEELRFGEDIPSSVADEDKQRIIELQKERTKLGDTDAGEIRKAQIKKEITELLTKKQEDAIQKDVKKEDAKKEDQPSEEGDAGKKEQEEVVIPEGDVLPQVEPKEGQEAVGDRFANPAAKTKEFKELSVEYKEKGGKFEDGINDADFKLQNIVEEKVPVASIVPTQTTLTTQAIEKPKTAGKPLLIKTDNGYFIEDGHHRIAKQIAEGVTDIDAEVYDPTAAAPIAKETYKKRKEKETQDIKDTTQKEIDDTTQSIDKTIEERDQLVTDIESLYRDVENALEEYEIIPDNATGKRAERRNSPIQKFVKSLGDTAKLNKALTALAGIKKEKAKKKGKDVGEIKLTIGDLPRQIPTDLRRKVVDLYNSKTEKNKSLRELQDKRDTATKRASDLEAQPQPEATAEEVAPMVKPPSLTTDEVSANAKIIDDNRFTRNPETGSLVKGGRKGKGKTPSKIATALSSLMTNVSKAFGKKPSELVPAIGTTTIEGAKELAEETVSDFRTSIEQDSNAPGGITLEKAIERNNGNPLSQTPDGKESKLYKDILTLPEIDGDTAKADKFKAQIYSDNFKNWFGDWQGSDKSNVSKVVDENGEPLMVYHGTPNGRFDIFDISKFGQRDEGFFGKGFYFAFDRYTAEFYASNEYSDSDGDILPVFLNIKNPLQDSESFIESLSSYTEITPINKELFNQIFKAVNSIREKKGRPKLQQTESTYNRYAINEYTGKPGTMQEILKGLGDALEISMEMGHDGIVSTQSFDDNQIVISNPNQIKSVFNNGQFSQTDNNIKLSQEGAPQNLEQFVDQVSTMMGTLKSMLPQIDNAIRLSKDAAEKKRLKEKKEIIKNIILEHSSKGKIEAKYSREAKQLSDQEVIDKYQTVDKKAEAKRIYDELGETLETLKAKKAAKESIERTKNPQKIAMANKVFSGEISHKDYLDYLDSIGDKPTIFKKVPKIPSLLDMAIALGNKIGAGVIGETKQLDNGTPISTRLDIPAYNTTKTYVGTVHGGNRSKKPGKVIGYSPVTVLTDVKFSYGDKGATRVAQGGAKSPFSSMQGLSKKEDSKSTIKRAEKILEEHNKGIKNGWVQVGMNPSRASWYYNKETMQPVLDSPEVIQIGALVLAKDPTYSEVGADLFKNPDGISFSQENSKYYGAALQSLQGTVILALTKNPGPSTFVHELFHAAEVLFNDSQKQFLVNQYNKWAKNKKGFPQAKNYGDLKNIKGKAGSRKGEPVVSEWAARAYEQYFTAGRDIDAVDGANNMSAAEKSTLKNILDTIHEAIKSIGQTIKQYLGEDITLSDEMVKFFDDITAGRNPKINEQVKTTKTEGAKDGAETVPEVQTEEGGVQEPEVSKQTFVDEINADREAKGQKPISIDKGGVFKKSDGTNYSKTTQDKFNKQFDAWKKEKLLAAGKIALKRGRLDRKVVRRMGSLRKSLSGKLTKRKGFFGPVKEILDKDTTKNLFNVRTQVTELINLPLHRLADKELADQIINTLKKLNESKGPIYAEIGDISKLVADAKKDLEVLNVDKITTVDSAASSVRTFIKAAQSMLATDIDMRNVGSLIRRVTNKLESIERLRDKLDQLESEYKSGSAEDKAKLEKIKKLRSDLSAIELPLLKKDLYAPDIVDSIEAQVDADIKNWTKDIESDSGLDFKPSPMERRQLDTLLDYLDNISETGYELDLKDKINIHDTLSSIRLAGIMPYSRFSAINRLSAKASANSKSNQNIADAIRKQYLDNDSFFGKMGRFLDPSKRLKINLGDAINQFRNLSTSLWPSKLLAGTDGYISKQLADMQSRQAEDGRDTGNTLQDIASKFVKLSKDANKTLTQNLRGTMAQLRGNKAKTSRVKIGMLLSERMFKTRYGEDFSNWGVVMKTQIDQLDNTPSVGFGNDYWSERKVYKEAFKDLVLDSEGNVDIEASVKKLSKAERAQFDFVTDFLNNNPEYLEKQEITAALNGMVFNVVDNYFPLLSKSRGIKSSAKDDSKGTLVNPILNQPKLISDRLKSAGDATPKLVEADVFNVLMDYVNQTNRDYYVAESVRGARTFFNESIKNANAEAVDSRSAREGFVTNMYIAMNTALESSLLDSYGIKKSNKLIDTILTGTYVDFLTGLERVSITEVLSEIPRSSIGGEINRQAFNAYWKEKVSSIRNIYKTGANKGTGVSFNLEGEVVMTKKVENNLRKLLRITRAPFLDTFNRMLTDSDADVLPKSRLGEARDYLLGFSNRATLYGQWMPAFNNAFREYTKENIDYSKLDDKEYLRKHRRAIKKAGEFANIETAKFRGLSRGIGEPTVSMALGFYPIDKNTSPTWFKVNRFMAAFGFRQATNVITSLQDVLMYAMFKGKDAPQTLGKAGRTIIAEAASGVIYGVVAQIMTNVTTYALLSLRDEEDLTEWEKEKLSALEEDLLGETDLFNELMGTLVFFTASKLGAAGRGLALIAAGLRVGNLEKKMRNAPTKAEKDRLEEEIAEINTLTKTFFYSSPVNLNQYGKYSTPLGIAKLFPFLALPADITEDFMEAESLRLDKDLNDVEQGEAFLLQAYNVAQMAMLLSGNVPPAISSAEKYVFGINKRKAKLKESAKGDNNKDKKSLKPKSLKGDL